LSDIATILPAPEPKMVGGMEVWDGLSSLYHRAIESLTERADPNFRVLRQWGSSEFTPSNCIMVELEMGSLDSPDEDEMGPCAHARISAGIYRTPYDRVAVLPPGASNGVLTATADPLHPTTSWALRDQDLAVLFNRFILEQAFNSLSSTTTQIGAEREICSCLGLDCGGCR
jgi:hypothetical protein